MERDEFGFRGEPVPGVFSIASNVPVIPSYPLIRRLPPSTGSDAVGTCPVHLNYRVSDRARSSGQVRGKTFESVNDNGVRLETPIGRFGRLSLLLEWDSEQPTLTVNKAFHRLAKVTIGNVHSVGWLVRDLSNVVLLEKGYALLHAAALRYGEKVVVIFGLSNTGKTTTVFSLVKEHGARFYGDDLLVTDGSKLYACPGTGANIDPDAGPGPGYRIEQILRRGLPFFENFAGTLSYSIADALGPENVATPAAVTDVLIMRRSDVSSIETIAPDRAAELLLASNRTEFTFGSSPLLFAAEYFETGLNAGKAIEREGALLRALSAQAQCHFAEGDVASLGKFVRDILLPD